MLRFQEDSKKLVSVEVVGMVLYWGCSVEVTTQMNKEEMENILDNIELESRRDLNVAIRGRLPVCHWCLMRGHIKEN